MPSPENTISSFSKQDLLAFYKLVEVGVEEQEQKLAFLTPKERCSGQSWFSQVEDFFDEHGEVKPDAMRAIRQAVSRLMKQSDGKRRGRRGWRR